MSRRRLAGDGRKLVWADEASEEPHYGLAVDTRGGASSSRQGSVPSSAGVPVNMPYALTYIITRSEARKLQAALAKVGIVQQPRPPSAPSTALFSPTPSSYPTTPGGGLPPRSPFVPLSAIKSGPAGGSSGQGILRSSTSGAANASKERAGASTANRRHSRWSVSLDRKEADFVVPPQPSMRKALATALDDDVLPASSRAALRAVAAGYSIHALLNALLPALLRRKKGADVYKSLTSAGAARIAAAFGFFSFIYRLSSYVLTFLRLKVLASWSAGEDEAINSVKTLGSRALARISRMVRGNGVVPFISALLASPALILLPPQTASKPGAVTFPRKTLALDLFTKALHKHFDILHRRRSGLVTWIPDWCDAALLYAVGQGQLLWAFLFEPDCFPKGYGDFILSRSAAYVPQRPDGLPSAVKWPSNRQIADHVALLSTPSASHKPFPSFVSPVLSALTPSGHPTTPHATINPILDWSPAHPAHTRLMCAMLHPNEPSCKANYLNFWAREWKQTAKFVAIFTAVFNVFRWRSWKRDPEGNLFRFALSVVQGATVISGNIASAWGLTCLFQHYLSPSVLPRIRYFFNGFLSSVFIYAVPAARRVQLGLYVARLSMDSTWQVLAKHRKVKSNRHGDVALLALGIAMMAALYEDMPFALGGMDKRIMGILTGPRLQGTASSTAGLPEALTSPEAVTANASNTAEFAAQVDSRLRMSAAPRKSS